MKINRLLCLLLTFLLLTSIAAPVVTAEPFPVAIVIGGVEIGLEAGILIAGTIGLVAVKEALENSQDDLHTNLQKVSNGWNNFLNGLSGRLDARDDNTKILLNGESVLYESSLVAPDGKKPDTLKVYHEAEVNGDTVMIKKESLTEKEAAELAEKMVRSEKRGIFSPNQDIAGKLFEKITGRKMLGSDIDIPHRTTSGYFKHAHTDGDHNCHLWWY